MEISTLTINFYERNMANAQNVSASIGNPNGAAELNHFTRKLIISYLSKWNDTHKFIF